MTARSTILRRVFVPRALLADESARRAYLAAVVARAHLDARGRRLRLRLRWPSDAELVEHVGAWRVPFIVARRTRVIVEVLAS